MKDIQKSVGSLFCIGIKGKALSDEEKKLLISYNVGGVILFKRNLETPQQIYDLCAHIQSLRLSLPEKTPFFIGVDMEGGSVQRLSSPFTLWPPLAYVGKTKDTSLAFDWGYSMGSELKSVGFNLNFAPCLDVLTREKNHLIKGRALSHRVEVVSDLGASLIQGYHQAGVIACAKHFPGHGNTEVDSHKDLPEDDTSLATLFTRELVSFQKALKKPTDVQMLMTAHIKFLKMDVKWPATLSSFFLKHLLREKLQYQNLVISDDLDMRALTLYYEAPLIPIYALKAGCDILLYSQQDSARAALETVVRSVLKKDLEEEHILDVQKRIHKVKKKRLKSHPPSFQEALKIIGCQKHSHLVHKISKLHSS